MSRPVRATVDLAALRHNAELAREIAPGSRVLAVVKADAYGHGVFPVVEALAGLADGFGVASLEEAEAVRRAGVSHPILLLEGIFSPEEIADAEALGLDVVIHSGHQIRWLEEAAPTSPVRVWLKLDSGMHRLGLAPDEYRAAHERLQRLEAVSEIVHMTHFARADEPDVGVTRTHASVFEETTAMLPGPRSLANSAAILAWPETHGDWIRPGIMLYGWNPVRQETELTKRLRPVMELATEIIAIREVGPGEAVGYGAGFVCDRPTRIGVAAIGYGDGYPRHAPDGTPILVAGRRTRIVGRVSMDMITVDLTDLPESGVGSPVELWGPNLSASEVAGTVGTISYELVTRVAPRVPRRYRG